MKIPNKRIFLKLFGCLLHALHFLALNFEGIQFVSLAKKYGHIWQIPPEISSNPGMLRRSRKRFLLGVKACLFANVQRRQKMSISSFFPLHTVLRGYAGPNAISSPADTRCIYTREEDASIACYRDLSLSSRSRNFDQKVAKRSGFYFAYKLFGKSNAG